MKYRTQTYYTDSQKALMWERLTWDRGKEAAHKRFTMATDISGYSQLQVNAIARQVNARSSKTLGFQTPAEMFRESVALTSRIRD